MRRLNPTVLAIVLAASALLGLGTHLVHGIQLRRNAPALLVQATRAEADNDLTQAERLLSQYLNLRPYDGPAWKRYAELLERRDTNRRRREQVFLVYEEALLHNPADAKFERRCADLALEMERYSDAARHLGSLYARVSDPPDHSSAIELAEIEDLLGQCDRGLIRYDKAQDWFVKAIEHDPQRVACYDRLARLRRSDLRNNDQGDAIISDMVKKNPAAARAYIYRWRYVRDFPPLAAGRDLEKALRSDLEKALELAPDDPEVLLTAAVASEQRSNSGTARTYFEKGFQLDPGNRAFALGLARLETREQHLDRAEEVLRRACRARESPDLLFLLAENLIFQGKIEGEDEAADYVARLGGLGLADTYVRYLEAAILFHKNDWAKAIPRIESARAALQSDRQLTSQLDLMLAECHGRLGDEEQRLDALRLAAEGNSGLETAQIALAQSLVRIGKLDQAVTVLMPLTARKPEWRLDLVRLSIQKTIRQPRNRRNWQEVEQQLRAAEKALPRSGEAVLLLRLDLLAAQGRLDEAQSLVSSALAKEPRSLKYRLAMARLSQRLHPGPLALDLLDQAGKDLGPSLELQLAHLDYWGSEGGDRAKAEVAKLADVRQQLPKAERLLFLDRLAAVEIRLGRVGLARRYWHELADLQSNNLGVRLALFDLALASADHEEAASLVKEVEQIENTPGAQGTTWRFMQASLLIDSARRGNPNDLDTARSLAAEIMQRRPLWGNGLVLSGQIAEIAGSPDDAIADYRRAVKLGSTQPSLVRRLVRLLNERNRIEEIKEVSEVLRDQGAAQDEIKIVQALEAIRNDQFDRGIALAREVFRDDSTSSSDHLMLGRLLVTAGRTAEAGKEFRRAVELGPGVPETWLTYAEYLVQTKRIDQAKAAVATARQALPADTLTLAQCLAFVGDAPAAEDMIKKALSDKAKSADPTALRIAITVCQRLNLPEKVDRFLEKLNRVPDLSPSDKAWANRARVSLLLGKGRAADRDRALKLVDENLRNDGHSIEDQKLKATILARAPGRRDQAISMLEKLAATNGLGTNERFMLAQLYLAERQEKKYRDEMRTLVGAQVKDPRHLAHLVGFNLDRNQLDEAEHWLAMLKKAEPLGLLALDCDARLLDLRKRKPELLALLENYVRTSPDQVGAAAGLFERYGFAKEAEAAYKAFAARDQKQPERTLALAQFLARQDRAAEAMAILKKAWTTCPTEKVAAAALLVFDAPSADETQRRQVEAWAADVVRKRPDVVGLKTKLGTICLWQGRFDESAEWYRRVLAESPDDADALNSLAWLLALGDQRKVQEALALINHAIDITGAVPFLVDTRAVVLIRAGQFDRAFLDLDRARTADPRNPNLTLHLAWAYRDEGRTDEARKALQRAEELGWKRVNSDPLERSFIDKLQRDLTGRP
jgi:predicted Zn-dependent protease